MEQLLQMKFAGNEIWRLAVFFIAVLLSLIVGKLAHFALLKRSEKFREGEKFEWAGIMFRALARPMTLIGFAAGVWLLFASETLVLPEGLHVIAALATRVLVTVAFGFVVYSLVDVVDHFLLRAARKSESKVDDMLVPLVGRTIRITVLVLVALQVAQAFSDKPVGAIVASLGVGGLAVALAGQDTIKNFFGSMVLLADKPFEIGDRVVVDGHDGPVESVGFRSTRIRTLDGHRVTVPNSSIVNSTVRNISSRPYIRRVMNLTITYDTPPEKVRRAVEIVKDVLDGHEGMEPEFPPRVHFSAFNDCALNILVLYWYHPPDYWAYLAFSERVNLEILERFNGEGIEFAFPSQTVYVANDDKRQMAIRMLREQT